MRRGDIIAKIEGEDTKGWTSDQAVAQAARSEGHDVEVGIRRAGLRRTDPDRRERDEIKIPTIPAYFMIDEQTGYIRLRGLRREHRSRSRRALDDLTRKGMKRLLLDLRDNPGGPLDQAISVSNRFLPRGDMIVYTRGRVPNSDQDYRATENSEFPTLPIIVLDESQQRERVGDRLRRAAGSRSRAASSARRRSARRWCSRSIASARAPAWR